MWTFRIASPVGNVPGTIVKFAGRPALAVIGGVNVIGIVNVKTVTPVDTGTLNPFASVTVAVMTYAPAPRYVCDTTALPVTAPRSCVERSPQSTVTSLITLPLVVDGVTTNVNNAGRPA